MITSVGMRICLGFEDVQLNMSGEVPSLYAHFVCQSHDRDASQEPTSARVSCMCS